MKQLTTIFLFLFIFSESILSCTLCSTTTPINVKIHKDASKDSTTFNIEWIFDEFFTKQIMESYSEKDTYEMNLEEVKNNIEEYIIENNYLAFIKNNKNELKKINSALSSSLEIKSNKFIYKFSFLVYHNDIEDSKLDIKFMDTGNFFSFSIDQSNNEQNATIEKVPEVNSFIDTLSKILKNFSTTIKELLKEINKSNSPKAYIWLLLFSFGYGVIHAIGPGHGKSLISSYFLRENTSYMKAFSMSSLIGIVHAFSAFILTFIIYYGVNSFFGNYLNNIETTATKISAAIIIFIALILIYKKIIKQRHAHSCECSSCKTNSLDVGVILAAGIVPCAGTVTIFIYTMSLDLYFIGFLSAIFMSLGMSLIIYITALLSIKVRNKSSSNTTLMKFFEYGSLVFILFLGVILFVA